MKILYTCCQPGYAGGTGRYVQILFEHFYNKYDVYLAVQQTSSLYSDLKDRYSDKLIDIDYPLNIKRIPELIKYSYKLLKLIKQERFDIIHCNGKPDHKLVTLLCSLISKKPKIIYTQHESHKVKTNYFTKKRLKNTTQIILTCDIYKKLYTDVGVKEESITFIPNCVDTEYFSPAKINHQEVLKYKRLYKIKGDDIVLGSIGTSLYKGWHYLTQAISRLESNKNIKVLLIGDIPAKEMIEKYIDSLGLNGNVILTGLQKDIRSFIAISDIGFLLSDSVESMSFVIREMMALGKPVIVSDYACSPYNIDERFNGYIVPVGDIEYLTGLIRNIVKNKIRLIEMGLNARKKAEREFCLQIFLKKTDIIYCKTAKEKDFTSKVI